MGLISRFFCEFGFHTCMLKVKVFQRLGHVFLSSKNISAKGWPCNIHFCFPPTYCRFPLHSAISATQRIKLDIHTRVSFTLYNLRHTIHYLRMHCAVTELYFAEFGVLPWFVQAASCFEFPMAATDYIMSFYITMCCFTIQYVISSIHSTVSMSIQLIS